MVIEVMVIDVMVRDVMVKDMMVIDVMVIDVMVIMSSVIVTLCVLYSCRYTPQISWSKPAKGSGPIITSLRLILYRARSASRSSSRYGK